MKFIAVVLIVATSVQAATLTRLSAAPFRKKPKLIVLLVIDQFRADYLTRFHDRFLAAKLPKGQVGGFTYLESQGAWIPFGEYENLQNMTGPGHATILTGAHPYQMGIPLNNWYDENGEMVYCAEDATNKTVGSELKDKHPGTSPKNLYSTTVGDELKNAGYPSRVVSIALKDRAAIFMGGHRADLALWFDAENFRWVSSTYYLKNKKLPAWVDTLNQYLQGKKDWKLSWDKPSGKPTGLSRDNSASKFPQNVVDNFGTAFPHKTAVGKLEALMGPFGVETTMEAVEKAILQYRLGNNAGTDLLAVSFSSHDYLGHAFGPNSLELEEMTVVNDRAISRLLNFLRIKVKGGLDQVELVLTADHGIPSSPEYLEANRVPTGRIDEAKLLESVNAELKEKVGSPKEGEYFSAVFENNFFLNRKALGESDAEEKVLSVAKRWLKAHVDGYLDVFTRSEWEERRFPAGLLGKQIGLTYHPGRSGDLVGIVKPYVINGDTGTSHQSGYAYDRVVPIIFTGKAYKSGVYSGEGSVVDIAPTLAYRLGIVPPSQSEGRVLSEILR